MADARSMGARLVIERRQFLGRSLLLMLLGASRRLRAAFAPLLRYRSLARPVTVPRADLATLWRARQFVADAVTLPSAARPNEPIRIAGMIVRISAGGDEPDRFRAVCARCPHEGCDCDFVGDAGKLPPEVLQEIGRPLTEPVYLCPCHNSTFKADDGERLSGPAPRGLYTFRVTGVTDTAVEIAEVEEDVLIFF